MGPRASTQIVEGLHIPLATPYTNDRLQAAIERVARILGQDLTTQNPILNTRLPDGSRVAVVGAPSSINGPTLTIRKFNRWYTSDELIESGSLPRNVRDKIIGYIGDKKNGIISGGTGSGKTTLMKSFLDHIPANERLLIIEQPAELKVSHPNAFDGKPWRRFPDRSPSLRVSFWPLRFAIVQTASSWARSATSAATTCCRR
jgi:Flp pilus assembly CpaF family ATPase